MHSFSCSTALWNLPGLGIEPISGIGRVLLYHGATREAPRLNFKKTHSSSLCIGLAFSLIVFIDP